MSRSSHITLENVHLHYSSLAFRESSLKAAALKLMTGKLPPRAYDVHALKGINLHIGSGERVGLIGHNGAGKSTLLKMIAGLYPISAGTRNVEGSIRSLFDLSLGFENEATGRENILYRGLLLGQTPKQMRSTQDAIIDFADLGEFIDYPVKTYSAGMLVRLAFAISTTVPGDILLLDEIIGAGDANFMQKAQERIRGLVNHAEIMILATHDMHAIKTMCSRALVFQNGHLLFDGSPDAAEAFYQNHMKRTDEGETLAAS
jgi:lipopolysaccharide transport system ATP-binding protein